MATAPSFARLRHRLILQTSSLADGGDTVWTDVATLWAAIEPVAAVAEPSAGHVEGVASHRITLRWRADVSSANRLRLGARLFRILAAFDPDESGRWLEIRAEEDGR